MHGAASLDAMQIIGKMLVVPVDGTVRLGLEAGDSPGRYLVSPLDELTRQRVALVGANYPQRRLLRCKSLFPDELVDGEFCLQRLEVSSSSERCGRPL